jgi:protein-S-isoprenylcysteine O-methyltransferase Ste14
MVLLVGRAVDHGCEIGDELAHDRSFQIQGSWLSEEEEDNDDDDDEKTIEFTLLLPHCRLGNATKCQKGEERLDLRRTHPVSHPANTNEHATRHCSRLTKRVLTVFSSGQARVRWWGPLPSFSLADWSRLRFWTSRLPSSHNTQIVSSIIMHAGSSSSSAAALAFTAASLAMMYLVQAQQQERKLREKPQQQPEPDAAAVDDDDDAADDAARMFPRPTTMVLERQLSTMSRSKRDRIVYNHNDEDEAAKESQDDQANYQNENHSNNKRPPVLSIGVPTKTFASRNMQEHHNNDSSCPVGVDVSFETSCGDGAVAAAASSSVEEVSSCDDDSAFLMAGSVQHDNDEKPKAKKLNNREWKGMKALFVLVLLWGFGVVFASGLIGIKSTNDVRTSWEQVSTQFIATMESTSSYLETKYHQLKTNTPEEVPLSLTKTTTTKPATARRQVKGAFGPYIGA